MNAASLTVMPILATPLGIATLADAQQLNPALAELFTQRAAADPAQARNPLRYTSSDDLLEWPEAPVQRLADGIVGAVYSLIGSVSDITEVQLRELQAGSARLVYAHSHQWRASRGQPSVDGLVRHLLRGRAGAGAGSSR